MSETGGKVLWTEAAVLDLENLARFIAADSPVNARKVLARLKLKAESLESSPHRGRIVPELAGCGLLRWRELIVRPYRLVYRIDGKRVYILAVLDSRRDLEDVLLERIVRV